MTKCNNWGNAKISGHLVEKDKLVLAPVYIGKRTVIGSNSLISPGCKIGMICNC